MFEKGVVEKNASDVIVFLQLLAFSGYALMKQKGENPSDLLCHSVIYSLFLV
jgi:hypothetical protein